MKTGIELIAKERDEQINKHGFNVTRDSGYAANQLIKAALFAINPDQFEWPYYWLESFRNKIMKKHILDRLVVAGALIAAEIDRLNAINPVPSDET